MKIYFLEYKEAIGKVDGLFCLTMLQNARFPSNLIKLGTDGIQKIWHEAKLRGRGYSQAGEIVRLATVSVDLKNGAEVSKLAVQWYVEAILRIEEQLAICLALVSCDSGKHGSIKISSDN